MSERQRNYKLLPSEGKYRVQRQDGSVPEWPSFVLGARDPAASVALWAYSFAAEALGMDPEYVADIQQLAGEFDDYCQAHGAGKPDSPPGVQS